VGTQFPDAPRRWKYCMTRTRYKIFETTHPYFLTCTIVGWTPIFTRPETVQIIVDSWQFLQQNRGLNIFGYVILENHLHFIASAPDLKEQISSFKSFTAHQLIELLTAKDVKVILRQLHYFKAKHKTDRDHQVWQEGSHPQMIQDEAMMWQKLEYMHNNPVERGYVDDPTHWRYSSARNYVGLPALLPIRTDWM
jgi:REP element-mobilizing transposase RayT